MSSRIQLFLLSALLLVGAGAWYLARTSAPVKDAGSEPLSVTLQDSINSVRKITVRGLGEEVILEGYGSDWKIANRDNYPALFSRVRGVLISLSEARIIEYKTSNPELYAKLGLQPIDEEGVSSRQVIIEDGTGKIMLDFIVGDESTGAIPGYYARYSDNPRSFLVDGELNIDATMRNWLDADLANIDADRVKEIIVRRDGEQSLRIYRESLEQYDFSIDNIPEGKEILSQTTLNRMGTILSALSAEDVLGKESFTFSDSAINTRVILFEGMVADITAEYVDGKAYATIDFSADEELVKAAVLADGEDENSSEFDTRLEIVRGEVAELNANFDDWLYQVPYFKYDLFDRKPGGLLTDEGEGQAAMDDGDDGGDDAAAPSQ